MITRYFAYGSNMNPARVSARGLEVTRRRGGLIAGLTVVSVAPGPDASRLIVTVAPPVGERPAPADLLASLDRASARQSPSIPTRGIFSRRRG